MKLVLTVVFTFLTAIPSQQSQAQVPPSQDATAVRLLSMMRASGKWSATSVPSDVVAVARVTRASEKQENAMSATFKFRGVSQFSGNYEENGSTTSTIVNGNAVLLVGSDNSHKHLPLTSSKGLKPLLFPFLTDLVDIGGSGDSLQYLGRQTIKGVQCEGIKISRERPSASSVRTLQADGLPVTVWLASSTGLPVRIDYVRFAMDNPHVQMHYSRIYSDYREFDGILVAYQQEELFEGQLMYKTTLTSVEFNHGLTNLDFDIPQH